MPNACFPSGAGYGAHVAGLVLAGGRSLRMGRDKAYLRHGGQTQLARTHALLASLVAPCHVSVRQTQHGDPLRAGFPCITDHLVDQGPAAGILAAHACDPGAAWLVVACDLPLLDRATLARLIQARAPEYDAVAYRDPASDEPEPLCAVWEPAACRALRQSVEQGHAGPRWTLLRIRTHWLRPDAGGALTNANTPGDLARLSPPAGAS